jgi:hypothetical protein
MNQPQDLDARLDLSWAANGTAPDNGNVTLRLTDETSGTMIVKATVPLNEFALALSSLAHRPCTVRVFRQAARLWGTRHENRGFLVEGLGRDNWADRRSITAAQVALDLPDWVEASVDFHVMAEEKSPNGHMIVQGEGYRVTLHRYVDADGKVVPR